MGRVCVEVQDLICIKCERDKPNTEFSFRSVSKGLRHYTCKACHRALSRVSHLKRTFSISQDQYNMMLRDQDGCCALCGGPETQDKNLAVDHCHSSGTVRALLCQACNTGMGKLREDPELIRAAADYVEEHLGAMILNA